VNSPIAVAVGPDGSVYVSGSAEPYNSIAVNRIDSKTGVITVYAGSSRGVGAPLLTPMAYDGQLATQMQFIAEPLGIVLGNDGTVYATDDAANALYGIDPRGIVHLVAGGAPSTVTTEVNNGPAPLSLLDPSYMTIDPDGSIVVLD
jgi:streptogramin lyase